MPRMGPRRGQNPGEKAKDFKGAMKRFFSELKPFIILIILALILAIAGAVLSIIAPNQLSKLTDEIAKGLMLEMDMVAVKKIVLYLHLYNQY